MILGGLRDKNFKFRCIYVPIRLDILPVTQQQAEKKMFVVTRKIMSRQTPEEQGHEKLGAKRFGVATQGISVATRTRLLNTIYVATLSKYVAKQSKRKPREQVAT